MLTGKTNTLQAHPALLTLQAALTAAESATPARPQRLDVHEHRAAQLIAGMRAGYRRPVRGLSLTDIPSPDARAASVERRAVELAHV